MLCTNRAEAFGSNSQLNSSSLPTTCFTDVVLIPLPTWLALVFIPILFALGLHNRKINYNPSTAHLRSNSRSSWPYLIFLSIYYFLIVANIIMLTVEIVRLSMLHYGIGLIPFAYVGLLLSAFLFWSEGMQGRIKWWQGINMIVWIGGIAVSVVQVIALEQQFGINGSKGSKYPVSDQILDIAVMAGVYAVIALLEIILVTWKGKKRTTALREERGEMGTFSYERDASESPIMKE
ncbi:predicted protein [Sclerotinia sclerotiorum 1980 UF-70]|uniref:Uncharacterized protein n=2 Tax=Sclerotinia sclerotiorum (strain ATCC 18683 / 1980 / Ss-1) TaxID=665079 RepID=A0A1D9Q180_SCLS1|nr:predicted protein [Sclerotinia sclerotiorum 1980 UF-70]APA08710.1 hypothetical protein sscle_04g034800 [Sclerotinia sclerotiorum 1980 UF-70]EDN99604.1 predicted protein [Sclerotinia sclerotiorum 1980 UF-70]